jgi:predicted Zn finger-like uncharacterized protein
MGQSDRERKLTTIIQCPNCNSRYRLKFDIAEGQQVRCPNCQTIWRYQSESMLEPLEEQQESPAEQGHAGAAGAGYQSGPAFGQQYGQQADAGEHDNGSSRRGGLGAPVLDESGGQEPAWGTAGAAQAHEPAQQQDAWGTESAGTRLDSFWQRGQQDQASGAGFSDESEADQGFDPAIAAPSPRRNGEFGSFTASLADSGAMGQAGGEQQPGPGWASELAAVMQRGGAMPEFRGHEGGTAEDAGDFNAPGMRQEPGLSAGPGAAGAEPTGADFWRDTPVSRALGDGGQETFGEIGPDGDWQPMSLDSHEDSGRPRGSLALAAAWGIYFTVAAGLIASALLMRDSVVQAMPGAAALYARVGMAPPANALGFDGVTYAWVNRDGRSALEVKGVVVNQTGANVVVPPLRISVRDNQDMEIAKTTAPVVKDRLGPHGKSNFTLEFLSAPQSVAEIELQLQR